ncbi:MAG: ATP-binding cassette domain-containing protein [Proteobacteria bacterium]|nr:ATP-binding cassette domain-containing protein [Pseudomonadota bacterium]
MLIVEGLRTKAGGPLGFAIGGGEIVALRGPSGAGKSLLLRAIADLDPAAGEVSLGGTPRARIAAPEWRRRVAYVPAESGWWDDRVGAHFPAGGGSESNRIAELIEALGLDPAALDWEVRRLSTGERHRLAIARALVREPEVWLFDEPTAALDAEAAGLVEAVIRKGRARGAAILLVTHDDAQAARLADRTLTMADGCLVAREGVG